MKTKAEEYLDLFNWVMIILLSCAIVVVKCLEKEEDTDEKQLQEMVDYHRSEGRNATIENGYIVCKEYK